MDEESRPSPPPSSPRAAGGPGAGLSTVYRELAIIALILAILAAGVWTTVVGKAQQEREKSMVDGAQIRFHRGHLTQPADDNAFVRYLDVLEKFPKSTEARAGIQRIGERYLEMFARAIKWHELTLAREILAALDTLKPWLEDTPLMDKLATSRLALRQLEQDMAERRESHPAMANRTFEPQEVFQDRLSDGNAGPNMIFIPGGSYLMGATKSELDFDPDEGPQMTVNVLPFAIGQSEVTFVEYDAFAAATGRSLPDDNDWGRADRPVINISWVDAREYAQWLSAETGFIYRLPTEAEWEYVARAGTTTMFSTGNCLHFSDANFDDRDFNAFADCTSTGKFRGKTVPVTSFPANSWGLYGVHGNVREWILDCWQTSYEGRPADSSAHYIAEGGDCGHAAARVLRGGVWSEGIKTARSANRYAQPEHRQDPGFGFRLARDVL